MIQQAVTPDRVINAIKEDPQRATELLTQHPALNALLASAYPELTHPCKGQLATACSAIPEVPAAQQPELTGNFRVFAERAHGRLEVRRGTLSAYECRLTLKDVEPGKTQKKVEALVEEMNKAFASLPNYPKDGWKVHLSANRDFPNYDHAGDIVITLTSPITDSTNRHRSETVTANRQERISQERLLSRLGLEEVKNHFARVAAGLFRLSKGFPADPNYIGTKHDPGNLFEGQIVRTERGPSSGSAASYQDGIRGGWCGASGAADADIGVVGGSSPELKPK